MRLILKRYFFRSEALRQAFSCKMTFFCYHRRHYFLATPTVFISLKPSQKNWQKKRPGKKPGQKP